METVKQLLPKTIFAVEATPYEQQSLWCMYAKSAPHPELGKPVKWEQMHGWVPTIKKVKGRPICLSLMWVKIDGYLVMFWNACSELVDHKIVDAWFKKNFKAKWDNKTRSATCDAMSFGQCIAAISERKELDRK